MYLWTWEGDERWVWETGAAGLTVGEKVVSRRAMQVRMADGRALERV